MDNNNIAIWSHGTFEPRVFVTQAVRTYLAKFKVS